MGQTLWSFFWLNDGGAEKSRRKVIIIPLVLQRTGRCSTGKGGDGSRPQRGRFVREARVLGGGGGIETLRAAARAESRGERGMASKSAAIGTVEKKN